MLELKNLIIRKTNSILKTFLILITGTAVAFTSCKKILLLKTDKTIWASGADEIGQIGNGTWALIRIRY